jgi:membrane associated rhomboid family serine protease
MSFSLLIILLIVTIFVSLNAWKNDSLFERMLYSPYKTKHNKEYYRIFSHMFIHADTTHLAFNMFSLYFLGSVLESNLIDQYGFFSGEFHFFLIYFFGGIFATLIPYSRNQDNPSYRSLGASGAVSSVIFAAILWNPTMQLGLLFIPIPIPAYIFGPIYLAFEYFADRRGGSGIAHDAHLGGALFGIAYILFINLEKGQEFFHVIFS